MINRKRLAETFLELVAVDSVSGREGALARLLAGRFAALGAEVLFDGAGAAAGSDTGNLVVRLAGSRPAAPLMFSAHLDTVASGRGVKAVFDGQRFTSDGTTILGADDKSAIAVLLEAVRVLRGRRLPHGPLELVFTVCEEVGLRGAKHLDYGLLKAPFGYALDATDTEGIITRAPAADHFTLTVHGRPAHAGAAPELGVNAIVLAARAIAAAPDGRIDRDTTCNMGLISGGVGTNVVAPSATVKGEVRSHHEARLAEVGRRIEAAFRDTLAAFAAGHPELEPPRLEADFERAYPAISIADDHPLVSLAAAAAAGLGRRLRTKISGGGSDANIFCARGVPTGVLGTGMREVHTTGEHVLLADMVRAAELVLAIVRRHAEERT